MDAGLPELPGVPVLLPVVVPVSSAVGSETEDIYLVEDRESEEDIITLYNKFKKPKTF